MVKVGIFLFDNSLTHNQLDTVVVTLSTKYHQMISQNIKQKQENQLKYKVIQ